MRRAFATFNWIGQAAATEEETGGAFLMFQDDLDAGKATSLHRHPGSDETFYMLEGEIALYVDGEQRQTRRRWYRDHPSRHPPCLHGHLGAGTDVVPTDTRKWRDLLPSRK
jgi:hypothetical protein